MHITFGWGFDAARWSEGDSRSSAALGSVVVGPAMLADILATRLALTRPEPDQPQRIAAYRAALLQVAASTAEAGTSAASWPTTALAKDPWTVARELLNWRDELVTAGWTADSRDAPTRITVLAQVEALLPTTDGWAPGPADTLRDVDATLAALATPTSPAALASPTEESADTGWPLGITGIDLDHDLNDLPPVWRRILDNLVTLGVSVTRLPMPVPLRTLRIRTAATEWDAAAPTARLLTDLAEAGTRHTVLTSESSELLDRELARLGGTSVGVRPRGESPLAATVPVFIRAMTAPHDVRAIADLLNVTVPGSAGDHSYPLLPPALHSALITALNAQPGVGGDAWIRAVAHAQDGAEPATAENIREFDQLIRLSPLTDDHGFSTTLVTSHLDWLARQFSRHGRGGDEASRLTVLIRRISDLVTTIGERISPRELDQIITEITGTGGLRAHAEASPVRDTVTSPSQLGTGTDPVIWWLPVDADHSGGDRTRPDERAWLATHGVDLPDRETLARLTLDSQLRALRRRGHITAILPDRVHGEAASRHPALAFLLDDLPREPGVPFTRHAESVEEPGVLPTTQTIHPGIPEFSIPDPVLRHFTPAEHLVPTRISYSQWEKLLVHPLEWLLERRLGITAGGLATVPTGNRMVGTWLHATVEGIVNRQLADNDGHPVTVHATDAEVTRELETLLPWYASELDLPGRGRERGATLAIAVRSITGLFGTLADAGIRIRAVEAEFETPLTGSHGGNGAPLTLRGFRDMDVVMADGTEGVIDLKYTFARRKYREAVENGTALQLAVYASSVTATDPGSRLSDIPVAYFSLNGNRLDTADPRFGLGEDTLQVVPDTGGAATADELWDRCVTGLNRILDGLRAGTLTDLGNLLVLQGREPDAEFAQAATAELARARETGFVPEGSARYTDFALITGVEGDRA